MADYMLDPPDDDENDSPCSMCDGSCYDDEPDYDIDEESANASSNWQGERF